MKIYKIIAALSAILLFSGCTAQAEINSESETNLENTVDNVGLNLSYDINPGGISHVHSSEVGTYFTSTTNGAIGYYDEASGLSTILCNRAECTHSDESCNAYIGTSLYGLFMNKNQDKLFVMYTLEERADSGEPIWYIDMMDANGENKEKIYTFTGQSIEMDFVSNDECIYFLTMTINPGSGDTELTYALTEVNYITGTSKIIKYFNEELSISSAFNNSIILETSVSYDGGDGIVYEYNINTDTLTTLKENVGGQSTTVFFNDEKMYSFEKINDTSAKLTQTNLITGEERVVNENVTYFGSHSKSINSATFMDEYIIVSSSNPPTTDTLVLEEETYAININTGEEIEINLDNGYFDYSFMYDMENSVVVFTDMKDTLMQMFDNSTGTTYDVTVGMPQHKIIPKEDYLNSINSNNILER